MTAHSRLVAILPFLLLGACAPEMIDDAPIESSMQELRAGTRVIQNLAGRPRYVRETAREVKLFLTESASQGDDPTIGFANRNHFQDSCGPTAAINAFKWYGIDELEGERCDWYHEPPADQQGGPPPPPVWMCRTVINPTDMGLNMKTNTWKLGTFTMPGTSTANFRRHYKHYIDKHIPANLQYQYRYDDGDGRTQYQILWKTLAQGHPVIVNYKTGSTKGHFAMIVGIEKVGNDNDWTNDKIFLANGRKEDLGNAISWSLFRELWRRDYNDFGALSAVGEERYTRINLWNSDAPPPVVGGGGGGHRDDGNPIQPQ
jgi:hypothetical protein